MNTLLKKLSYCLLAFSATYTISAQELPERTYQDSNKIYLGLGTGLDYGGIGTKLEYLPIKEIGLFAGIGYNLQDVGFNIGASYKIKVAERLSINPMAFYGYNAVMKIDGYGYDLNKVSYGLTYGVNLDIYVGKNGDKLTTGLFIPTRSKSFNDHYDAVKASPSIKLDNKLSSVLFTIGYNWRLK